jgi:hypothetical protein
MRLLPETPFNYFCKDREEIKSKIRNLRLGQMECF